MESLMEMKKPEYSPRQRVRSYSSYSPCQKTLVTFTLPPDYFRLPKLSLPSLFMKENGINKPGEIYLLGKDGKKCLTNLLQDSKGTMSFGKGWKDFLKANGIKTSFTLKLIWEDTTPLLSLCDAESTIEGEQGEFSKTNEKESLVIDSSNRDKTVRDDNDKEKSKSWERNKNYLRGKDSTPSSEHQLVTLTITPDRFRRLRLPKSFTKENDINKPGMISLLGKDGKKHQTTLLCDKGNKMTLGGGWKSFVTKNGLKIGDSFTLKLIWEDTTPMLRLCPEHSIDKRGGCSETNHKKSLPIEPSSCKNISKDENIKEENSKERNNQEENKSMEKEKSHLRERDSTQHSQKRFVTFTITPSSFTYKRLIFPTQFARKNNMTEPGMMINLVGKDGKMWPTNTHRDKNGTMSLGKGWIDFGEAHDLKSGGSFTMELKWEDATPMLSWVRTDYSNSKANKNELVSAEPRDRDSSSGIQNQFVTLAPTPEDVSACQLYLPSQFMKANGINRLGKITLLGGNGTEWSGYLLSQDGLVALGIGWNEFCEANGVKSGEPFTLEFINVLDKPRPVLKFCSPQTNRYKIAK